MSIVIEYTLVINIKNLMKIKLTKENIEKRFSELPQRPSNYILSNGTENTYYRATVKAIIERGFLDGKDDKIEWILVSNI